MKHTIDSIRKALEEGVSDEVGYELVLACEPLRAERRQRIQELTPFPSLQFDQQPAAYRALLVEDPLGPEQERNRLAAEMLQLDALESLLHEARQGAVDAHARSEIPKALKRMPKGVQALKEKLAALEAAIEAFNQDTIHLQEYARLMGKTHVVPDSELSAMLELRNRLWEPLRLHVPFTESVTWDPESESAKRYPKSWPLLYELRGPKGGGTSVVRQPPSHGFYLPDYSEAVRPIRSNRAR